MLGDGGAGGGEQLGEGRASCMVHGFVATTA